MSAVRRSAARKASPTLFAASTDYAPVSTAPASDEIFDRAIEEGTRRLDQSALELVATSFIAGFTVVFGVVALGIVHAAFEPEFGEIASVAGSLAFAPALVFLVVGRTELFNENFFDPAAAAFAADDSWLVGPLLRLWVVTLVLNFVGAGTLAAFVAVEGAIPSGSTESMVAVAEHLAGRPATGAFASAVLGGALVALLSFMLEAVDSVGARVSVTFMVGFFLALGPFDHAVVTVLHVFFGVLFGGDIGYGAVLRLLAVSVAGNVVGGLGLVTLSHVAQVMGGD
jgi:formate/nitrite transporter FocA (FNT family)